LSDPHDLARLKAHGQSVAVTAATAEGARAALDVVEAFAATVGRCRLIAG